MRLEARTLFGPLRRLMSPDPWRSSQRRAKPRHDDAEIGEASDTRRNHGESTRHRFESRVPERLEVRRLDEQIGGATEPARIGRVSFEANRIGESVFGDIRTRRAAGVPWMPGHVGPNEYQNRVSAAPRSRSP